MELWLKQKGNLMETHFTKHQDIFVCPVCGGDLGIKDSKINCFSCQNDYQVENGIPQFFVPNEWESSKSDVTGQVRSFYEQSPFPDYENTESAIDLIRKAKKGVFANLLDEQVPYNIKVLDAGCGTGQLCNFLATSHRYVFGVDMCNNSLELAQNFKMSNELERVGFYRMNLFKPVFKEESFSLVICNGALHHTSDPFTGFKALARLVIKGGYILVGLYNKYGRVSNDLRKFIFRITNDKFQFMDPRLRIKGISQKKKNAWFNDQYKNPHESKHTIGEVLGWFERTGFEYINSIPVADVFQTGTKTNHLFGVHSKGDQLSRLMAQIGMLFTMRGEGGLFIMIGKRKS